MKKLMMSLTSLVLCFAMIACSSSWVTQATNIIVALTPTTLSLLQFIAAAEGVPLSQLSVATVDKDTTNIVTLLKDYSAATAAAKPGVLAKLRAELAVTRTDLTTILSTAGVKDPQKLAEIQAGISLILGEVDAIISLTQSSSPTMRKGNAPLSASQFKKSFNSIMIGAGRTDLAVK